MAVRIFNNLASINAQRHLGINNQRLAQSIERVSSGLRINSASDDAAGLAVVQVAVLDMQQKCLGGGDAEETEGEQGETQVPPLDHRDVGHQEVAAGQKRADEQAKQPHRHDEQAQVDHVSRDGGEQEHQHRHQ